MFLTKVQKLLVFTTILLSFLFNNSALGIDPTIQATLKGKVLDSKAGVPMEFATISLYTTDSVLVNGTITSKTGEFEFRVQEGKYYILVQFIGYRTSIQEFEVTRGQRTLVLGNILLEQDVTNLSEVTVTAERSEMVFSLDKKVFNVGRDLTNAGQTALDILDNIPTVTVDVEGNVSLRGSQGVKILIDGKPSGLVASGEAEALRSLQGTMVERVEVITNPSVRYEAEGMAGIINIVLKQDHRQGVNGSFEISAGTPEYYSFGANVNFRKKKMNYFVNYGINYRQRPGKGFANQLFYFPDTISRTVDRERTRGGWSQNLRGGADIFLNDLNTLTASVLLGLDNNENNTSIWYNDFGKDRIRTSQIFRRDLEQEDRNNIEFALNHVKKFRGNDDRKLTAMFQYMLDSEVELSDITEEEYILTTPPLFQRTDNRENERNLLFQADYVHPFAGKGKLEVGYRGEIRTIANPYKVEQRDIDNPSSWNTLGNFSNDFDYHENIQAIYLLAGKEFGPFSLQAGVRGEYSMVTTHLITTGQKNERDYFNPFPSLHATWKISENHSVQTGYSRRINRPSFWALNPFFSYSDARNIRSGNPNLEPEFTHSMEAGYLFIKGRTSIYAGGFYRHTNDLIERVSYVDSSNITYTIPQNLSEQRSRGMETNLSLQLFKWWDLGGNINFYRATTSGTWQGKELGADSYTWNTRMNTRFRLPHDLSAQAVFFYRGPQERPQGRTEAFYMLDLAISKDLFKKNATVTLNIRDLLDSRVFRFSSEGPGFYSENEFRWSTRSVRLTFVYRLNQKKQNGANRGQSRDTEGGGGGDMEF